MMGKRKRYSAEFKAKVAMEALRGELTASQLASKHGVHQTMVGEWKRQAMEGLVAVFSGKVEGKEGIREEEVEKLHATMLHGSAGSRGSAISSHRYGRRMYSGRPSWSIRFNAFTAIATSVARR